MQKNSYEPINYTEAPFINNTEMLLTNNQISPSSKDTDIKIEFLKFNSSRSQIIKCMFCNKLSSTEVSISEIKGQSLICFCCCSCCFDLDHTCPHCKNKVGVVKGCCCPCC